MSLLLAFGIPLTLFGVACGARNWIHSAAYDEPATAGTVMVAAFTTAAGLFGIVQAMIYDILSLPTVPLTPPRIGIVVPVESGPSPERDQLQK